MKPSLRRTNRPHLKAQNAMLREHVIYCTSPLIPSGNQGAQHVARLLQPTHCIVWKRRWVETPCASLPAFVVTLDRTDPNRKTLVISLNPGLSDGLYTVNWKNASMDGHGETGRCRFRNRQRHGGACTIPGSIRQYIALVDHCVGRRLAADRGTGTPPRTAPVVVSAI